MTLMSGLDSSTKKPVAEGGTVTKASHKSCLSESSGCLNTRTKMLTILASWTHGKKAAVKPTIPSKHQGDTNHLILEVDPSLATSLKTKMVVQASGTKRTIELSLHYL